MRKENYRPTLHMIIAVKIPNKILVKVNVTTYKNNSVMKKLIYSRHARMA